MPVSWYRYSLYLSKHFMSLEGRHTQTKGMGYVLHSLAQSNLIPITKSPKSLNALLDVKKSQVTGTLPIAFICS